MGIINGDEASQSDVFNLSNNYGVLPFDRRHIFNAAYSIELGNPFHGNKIVEAW